MESPGEGSERRVHAQVSTCIVVKYANDLGTFDEYMTRDLSMGGVFIQTDNPQAIGARLEIILCLPDGSLEVAVLGEVVRHNPLTSGLRGMGIRFVLIEPALQHELEQFIRSLLDFKGEGQRAHPRIKARLRVQVKIRGELNRALLEDISKGGLFVHLDGDIEVMDHLEVLLVHPHTGKEIAVIGQVMHKRDLRDPRTQAIRKGIGLQFFEMSDEKRQEIADFLQSLASG